MSDLDFSNWSIKIENKIKMQRLDEDVDERDSWSNVSAQAQDNVLQSQRDFLLYLHNLEYKSKLTVRDAHNYEEIDSSMQKKGLHI
jgi:hypothetical protein